MEELTNPKHSVSPIGLINHDNLEQAQQFDSGLEQLVNSTQGYIVGRIGNELLRLDTDTHLLTVAPTGGGKGSGLIIPNLLDHLGSAFVIDIRGETVAKTATARMLQGHQVVVLDPYNLTKGKWGVDRYNPLDALLQNSNSLRSDDLIQRLAKALMFDPSGRMSNEPIWDNATNSLISGLIALCVRYWPPHKQNLISILDVLNYTPKERELFVKKLSSLIENDQEAAKDRQVKTLLSLLTEAKSTTKVTDNAIVQAQTLLRWAGNRSFEAVLENSTFSFNDLQNKDTTVYLVVPEEFIDNCAIWVRLILESAVFSVPDIFSSTGKNTAHLDQEERVLFLLDELPAFGQLDIVSNGMATLRGRGINLWLFIQNIAQLEATYGKEKTKVIIGNTSFLQVFGSTELEELEYLARLVGEEFHDVKSISSGVTQN